MKPVVDNDSDREVVIKVSGLTKRFRNITAVDDLNLEVYRGDVFGFLGPNGAGKSTTIRMLLGLISPDRGEIELLGQRFNNKRPRILSGVGSMVETPTFYPYLTARRNLKILGNLCGGVSERRMEEVLELVGLRERTNSRVKSFSHGMLQRLGIAQALLSDPQVMILDEPTAGLDPKGMKEVRELIMRLSAEGEITIFLSSHLLFEIEQVATRMAIIDSGKLVVQGGVRELLSREQGAVLVVERPEEAVALLESAFPTVRVGIVNRRVEIGATTDKFAEINSHLVENGFRVSALIPKRSLEDFFLSITQR